MTNENSLPTGEYKERLLRALEAARTAGNPVLVQSLLSALEGRPRGAEECGP
jgi:hypothetical protein